MCGLAVYTVCLLRSALDSLGMVDRPGITKVELRFPSSTSVSRSATRHLRAAFEETSLGGGLSLSSTTNDGLSEGMSELRVGVAVLEDSRTSDQPSPVV